MLEEYSVMFSSGYRMSKLFRNFGKQIFGFRRLKLYNVENKIILAILWSGNSNNS